MFQLFDTNIEKYNHKITIVLLVEPYNDFIAFDGKLYPYAKEVLEEVYLLNHLKEIIEKARQVGIQIFYVPHHSWVPGNYSKWSHPNSNLINSVRAITFEKDTWGGAFHDDFQSQEGDIIIKEQWAQSGFENTDLDYQSRRHGINKIIVIGMLANTCIESTARFGIEIGYHFILVKDATAAFSKEMMHAAHELNGRTFAHTILSKDELNLINQG
ncbi:isochorismatase family cysteine hydrolase [Gottfriedia sp. NPDC057948]|uniref:isochorismatase family cysteine hydrolase n=1 Tax=Gottfriedia sp. NPDC057948 TaxID=3346287 RepID=UPI0036DC3BAC